MLFPLGPHDFSQCFLLLHYIECVPSRFSVFLVNSSLVILASFSLTTCETLNIAEALGGLKIFILQFPFSDPQYKKEESV